MSRISRIGYIDTYTMVGSQREIVIDSLTGRNKNTERKLDYSHLLI